MAPNKREEAAIRQALTEIYFPALYDGDAALLAQVFHPGALLFGDIQGRPYAKNLAEYLRGVAQRVTPKASGQPYETNIMRIELVNTIAVATVRVRMYEFNYFDILSFHKTDNRWLIVNKLLTHVDL